MNKNESLYSQVKQYILDGISLRTWVAGDRVPSENELVDLCKVSRMTARRALQELFFEGTLIRIKGKGSFVAEEKQQSSLLQIKSIATEIRELGQVHHSQLLALKLEEPDNSIISAMNLSDEQLCAHSQLLHYQNHQPVQLEFRWVNLDIAPDYIEQDFSETTPSEYLFSIAPVTAAEHRVEAIIGSEQIRELLEVDENEAVLLLERKTWCNNKLVSYARLYHPGNSYSLGTKFTT